MPRRRPLRLLRYVSGSRESSTTPPRLCDRSPSRIVGATRDGSLETGRGEELDLVGASAARQEQTCRHSDHQSCLHSHHLAESPIRQVSRVSRVHQAVAALIVIIVAVPSVLINSCLAKLARTRVSNAGLGYAIVRIYWTPRFVIAAQGFSKTLPLASRRVSMPSASAAFSSGKIAWICASSLPSRAQVRISALFSRLASGSAFVKAPQNTPTISQPLSSARLSGIFGIVPAAKPTTRKRPFHAIERTPISA